MGAAYIEKPEDEFDYQTDFLEVIDNHSPAATHLSNDVQEATLLGIVPANKIRSCAKWFCGFAFAEDTDPWGLRRTNPQWHPEFPQLRAYDVSFQKFVPKPNILNPNFEPYFSPEITDERTAYYERMLVTVRYRNFMYRFREDDDIPVSYDEWRRHTFVTTQPRVETLQVSGGQSQLTFCESSATGPPIEPSKTPFPAPIAFLQNKIGIVITWFDVPWEYVSEDDFVFTPTKLNACVGKVNSQLFLDRYEPGTLLAEPYTVQHSNWVVPPADVNDPLRKVTLSMPFVFFDPERGADEPAGAPFARGHNLMPWGGVGATTNPGGDGKYYLATRDGTTTGRKLLEEADFTAIFTHVSDPNFNP